MSIKKPLLAIVQEILSDMDSDNVNTISDSVEAQQVSSIVERTFYNIIATRDIADEYRLLTLTPLTNDETPTSFVLEDNVKDIQSIQYNIGTLDNPYYRTICYVEPWEFMNRINTSSDGFVLVNEPMSGLPLKIRNDQHPSFFTTFDDKYLFFDSYDSKVDDTLQEVKTRAYGSVFPTFMIDDEYVPEIAPQYFPYLVNESKSVAFDVLKGGTTPKVDQAARRQKAYIQNDKYRVQKHRTWNDYGRN